MAAKKKKPAIDTGELLGPSVSQIEKRYGKKMPAGMRSGGLKGNIHALQGAVSEGPWGGTIRGDKNAEIVARKQWARTFGPQANKPRKAKSVKKSVVKKKK